MIANLHRLWQTKGQTGWFVVYTEIVMFFLSQRTNTKFICIQYLSIQENSLTLPVLWTYILAFFYYDVIEIPKISKI